MSNIDTDSRVCWWMLLGFALTAPFVPLTGIPIAWDNVPLMDWQRLFEAATLFGCMAWALASAPSILPARSGSFYLWAVAFLLGLTSALLMAEHLGFALLEWSWILLLTSIVVVMRQWGIVDRQSLDRQILWGIWISCVAYLAWYWYLNANLYFEPIQAGSTQTISFPGFSNIRYFSDYQSFMLLLLPAALDRIVPEKHLARFPAILATSAYFSLAVIAGSRSLIAAHLILHSAMLLLLGKRYWPFLKTQLRFWLYGGVIFFLLTWLPPLLISGVHAPAGTSELWRTDSSSRVVLWQLALDVIRQYPLLGIGPMHYANIPNPIASHPHNLILQFASEWGVIATVIFMWLVGRDLFFRVNHSVARDVEPYQTVGFLISCALLALIVQSMVAGTLNYPNSQVLALLCFAYPMANNAVTDTHGWRKGYSMSLIGLIALGLSLGTLTTLQSIRERNQCFHFKPWPSSQFATRFWQQGWLVGPCSNNSSLLSRWL